MRKSSSLAVAFLLVAFVSLQLATAQIPRIPHLPKPKPSPTPAAEPTSDTGAQPAQPVQPATRPAAAMPAGNAGAGADQPTIAKDTVQVTAFTNNVYKGNYDNWSWIPKLE